MIQKNDQFKEYDKMIDKISELLARFDEQLQQNLNVAILVGYTGNGKSTIFNFLSGFEFQIKQEINKKIQCLALKNSNEKYASEMASGINSITKEPHYYYNKDYNYLLIDFPGFNDTDGAIYQELISILFNRLILKTPIRLISVFKTVDGQLPNRALELKNFINRCFALDISNFSNVTLILNQYMGALEDKDLIELIKDQLTTFQLNLDVNENIAVIRQITDDGDLERKLNEQKRQEIWKVIEKSDPIRFKSIQLRKKSQLAKFINKKYNEIIENLNTAISRQIEISLNTLNEESIKELFQKSNHLTFIINKKFDLNFSKVYEELLLQLQEIAILLGWENNQQQERDIFVKIFKFVLQEDDIIQTKDLIEKNLELIKMQLKVLIDTLLDKLVKNEIINREAEVARQRQRDQQAEAARQRNQAAEQKQNNNSCKIM